MQFVFINFACTCNLFQPVACKKRSAFWICINISVNGKAAALIDKEGYLWAGSSDFKVHVPVSHSNRRCNVTILILLENIRLSTFLFCSLLKLNSNCSIHHQLFDKWNGTVCYMRMSIVTYVHV